MEPTEQYDASPTIPPAFGSKRQEGFRPVADRESYVDVPGLLVKFERQSPVLHIVESLLYAGSQPPDSLQPLFSALANSHRRFWHERVVSTWALGRMELDAQERDAAASMLLELLKSNRGQNWGLNLGRGVRWAFRVAVPSSVLLALFGSDGFPFFDTFFTALPPLLAMAGVVTIPMSLMLGKTRAEHDGILRAASAETLGRLGAVEGLSALADALYDRNQKVREAAALALRLVLPTLTAEQYGQFDSETMHSLGHALSYGDVMLVFTILEAYEKVGTSVAVPYVSRMAKSGQTPLVRQTAERVLAVLEARKKSKTYAEELGRPSAERDTPADELLRPDETPYLEEPLL